jgi:endo-1,4-beta-xylanase
MVAFTQLAFAASAIVGAIAAPSQVVDRDAPDFEMGVDNLVRRQDYNQNYKTGGSVNFSPSSTGYTVSFSGAGDFVVGKGWKTGTNRYVDLHGFTSNRNPWPPLTCLLT